MPKIVVLSDGPEGLAQLQDIINQLEEAPEVEPEGYETEELVEDEDLPLVVQLRLPDEIELSPGFTMKKWVDTNIDADDLDQYREQFPEQEYRLVAVYDEIVTVDDSVDQQEVSAEDEIGQLKAEILQLKALIANYENAQ
jgi:hypothetical protein